MIVIREGAAVDIPVLRDFSFRLPKETENTELNADALELGLQALFADASKGQYFVAVDEEEQGEKIIVGCVSISFEWSNWLNDWVWWLQNVYVKQSHRKRGVFRSLFGHVMKMVNDNPSVKGLRLHANKGNAAAHKMYKAMGMNGDHYVVFETMK